MEAASASTRRSVADPTAGLVTERRRWGEDAVKGVLFLAAALSVVTTIGILASLTTETVAFLSEVGIVDYLFGTKWAPTFADPAFGVLPLVTATLLITGIAMVVAIPLGLGAAIYLSEYARPRTRKAVKPVLELLAGIPTIVFGYFALTWFTPEFLKALLGIEVSVFNALAAGVVMGFMVIPTIASISEDAMSAVPTSLREGAYGLGASRLQVSMRVVFPAALSGIVAAIVLGVSRAIGETMIVAVAAGNLAQLTADPTEPMQTMTAFIAAVGRGDVPTGSTAYQTIFAVGATLFVLTFLMNLVSIRFVRRFRQAYD